VTNSDSFGLESNISVFGETFRFHQNRKMPILKQVTSFRANPSGNGVGKRPISKNPSINPVGKRPISKKPMATVNDQDLSNHDVTDIINTWSESLSEQNEITGTDAFLVAIGAAEEVPMEEDNSINTPPMEDSVPMEASQRSEMEPFEDFLTNEEEYTANTWDIQSEAAGAADQYVEPQLFSDYDFNSNFEGQVYAKPVGAIESLHSEPFELQNLESQPWVPVSLVEGKKVLQTVRDTEVLQTIDMSAIQTETSPTSTELPTTTVTTLMPVQPSTEVSENQESILPDTAWVPESFDQDMFIDDFCHAINSNDKKPDLLEIVLGEAGVTSFDNEINNPTTSYTVEMPQGEPEKRTTVERPNKMPLEVKPLKKPRGRNSSKEQKHPTLMNPRLSKVEKVKTGVKKKAGRPMVEEPIKVTEVPKIENGGIDLSSFKYRRMRDLNNVASRKCRVNRKMKVALIEEELLAEEEKNVRLTADYKLKLGQRDKLRSKLISMGLICPMGSE